MSTTVDYGQDAPRFVRFLIIGGAVLIAAALGAAGSRIPASVFWYPGGSMLATGLWMIWSSRFGKQRMVESLLDRHPWQGFEVVLDIGCGRGLAAIAAARRAQSGRAVGLDRWRGSDLSGNSPDATRANAKAADVMSRISLVTGEATRLPFDDDTFDVVISVSVFHNIKSASGRRMAVEEALRVVRPGGTLLIYDILYARGYATVVESAGARDIWLSWPIGLWALPGWSMRAEKSRLNHVI